MTPGETLHGRWRVLQAQGETLHVLDLRAQGPSRWKLQRSGSGTDPDVLAPVAEDVSRRLSWLRSPGLFLPDEVYTQDGSLWSVSGPVDAQSRLSAQTDPSVLQAVRWVSELCSVYHHLHTATASPLVLGRLSWANLVLSEDGRIGLSGFRVTLAGDIELEVGHDSWTVPPPDNTPARSLPGERPVIAPLPVPVTGVSAPHVRDDVYCLGVLLQRLTGPQGSEARCWRDELWRVVAQATHRVPDKRFLTMQAFKQALDALVRALTALETDIPPVAPAPWRFPVRWRRIALLTVLTMGAAWGVRVAIHDAAPWVPVWRATSVEALAVCPDGTRITVRGQIEPLEGSPLLRSPLSGVPCVGYTARIDRQIQQQTLDPSTGSYRLATHGQTLMDGTQWIPFRLAGGSTSLQVAGSAAELRAPPQTFTTLPDGLLAVPGLPSEPGSVPAVLPPGAHVLSVSAGEQRVVPGESVVVSGTMSHKDGERVLSGPLVVVSGNVGPIALAGMMLPLLGSVALLVFLCLKVSDTFIFLYRK